METASVRAVEDTEVLAMKGSALMNPSREEFPTGFELRWEPAKVIAARLIATRLQFVDAFAVE